MPAIGVNILQKIKQPRRRSHKGQNGVLYIAAGSRQYHGALLYAVMAASYFVDLIYVETDPSNYAALVSLKKLHPAIIIVRPRERRQYLTKSNCLLLGPGLGKSVKTRRLVQTLLRLRQRPAVTVIDADALAYARDADFTTNTIITPHPAEYQARFGSISPRQLSRQIPAVILAKGLPTQICQNGKCQYNTIGIARFTKGGMGDVLAGLVAALACTNPPLLAAQAASKMLSLTTHQLAKRYGTSFSILKVIERLPKTLTYYQRRRR